MLVDQCQLAEQIDAAEVEQQRASAQASLGELSAGAENEVRRDELAEAIERAGVWLEVVRKG